MKSNRRGTTPTWVIILMLIMIVSVILFTAFMLDIGKVDSKYKGDKICTYSNSATGRGGVIGNLRPEGIGVSSLCTTQFIKITPEDSSEFWRECDENFKNEFDSGRRTHALRSCTAQQVANLFVRCWNMGWKGTLDPGSWVCFNVHISGSDTSELDSEHKLEQDIKGDVGAVLCPGKSLSSGDDCSIRANSLAVLLIDRIKHKSIIDYYAENSASLIAGCLVPAKTADGETIEIGESYDSLESGFVDDGLEVNAENIVSNGAWKVLVNPSGSVVSVEDRSKEIVQSLVDYEVSLDLNTVKLELDDKLDYSRIVIGLIGDVYNRITSEADRLYGDKELEKAKYIQAETEEAMKDESNLVETNPCTLIPAEVTENLVEIYRYKGLIGEIDNIISVYELPAEKITEIIDIGKDVPDIGNIDRDFMVSVMKSTQYTTDKTYCDESSCSDEKLEFYNDFVIATNTLFEIGYCDPPNPIGGGLDPNACDAFGNRQRLIVASSGEGIGRGGSPYPSYCRLLNTGIDIPEIDLEGICTPLLRGAFD